ncbi:YARHG domain-containing protein [Lachnospiraceae bacterium ZAX-1]
MYCENCKIEIDGNVQFCRECGRKLIENPKHSGNFCHNCGSKNREGAVFCASCGNQIGVPISSTVNHTGQSIDIKPKAVHSKKPFIIIGIVVLALAIVGMVAFGTYQVANSPKRLLSLGDKCLIDLDYKQALVQYKKVIEIEPTNVETYLGTAEAYIGLGQTENAIAVLHQGLKATSQNAEIQAMLEKLTPVEEAEAKPAAPLPEPEEETIPGMPVTFLFASGAGAWGTTVDLNSNGTFSGYYSDSDMGQIGDGYPNGTMYECSFRGKFSDVKKISDYEYSMKIDYLDTEGTVGEEKIIDGINVITSDPYGFDNADEFLLYLPGRPTMDLPEAFKNWMRGTAFYGGAPETMVSYGLYNIGGEEGFSELLQYQKANMEEDTAAGDGYLMPEADTRYYTEADLAGVTQDNIRYLINELYARHGRIFSNETFAQYFSEKPWYVPATTDVPDSAFNEYELANRDLLVQYEEKLKGSFGGH